MRRAAALLAVLAAAPVGCADPVHDQAVRALGSEDPNVPPGPLHRPGQPCLACHGGEGPASLQFSLGGTVLDTRGAPAPAVSAYVQTEDIEGRYWAVQTNAAGNFYVGIADFEPDYPIQMSVLYPDAAAGQQMQTYSGRDGSCADCHQSTTGPTSPGPVYLNLGLDDGGGAAP